MNRLLSISLLMTAGVACVSSDQLRRQEYDARYQQAVQMCGHPDAAFQAGYNAGYGGNGMHAEWTQMCTQPARDQAFAAYQSGFLQGANNAPIHVVHTVTPRRGSTVTTTAPAECTFDSDCGGDGWHCRDHTCMGFGSTGDRCVFNDECLSDHCFGGTCRE